MTDTKKKFIASNPTRLIVNILHTALLIIIGVEYARAEGLEAPPEILQLEGFSPCRNFAEFNSVAILTNPENLDVAKKENIHA